MLSKADQVPQNMEMLFQYMTIQRVFMIRFTLTSGFIMFPTNMVTNTVMKVVWRGTTGTNPVIL